MVYFCYLISLGAVSQLWSCRFRTHFEETWTFLSFLLGRNRFFVLQESTQKEIKRNFLLLLYSCETKQFRRKKKSKRNNKLVVEKLKAFFIAMTTVERWTNVPKVRAHNDKCWNVKMSKKDWNVMKTILLKELMLKTRRKFWCRNANFEWPKYQKLSILLMSILAFYPVVVLSFRHFYSYIWHSSFRQSIIFAFQTSRFCFLTLEFLIFL